MTRELLDKANDLKNDIRNIERILAESEKHHWIKAIFHKGLKVTSPYHEATEVFYSVRFQRELAEWLKQKLVEYQKEFEELR